MTYQHPIAEIINTQKRWEVQRTILKLDWLPAFPIAPASLFNRYGEQPKVLDLHTLEDRNGSILTFVSYDNADEFLNAANTYNFISWWSSDQLEIAQGTERLRHKQSFVPKDMVSFKTKGGQIGRQQLKKKPSRKASW